MRLSIFMLIACLASLSGCKSSVNQDYEAGEWEKLTLSFEGPETSESETENPFLNYRLEVTFTNDGQSITIPGFYAADGQSAESGAESGNVWQVRFRPPAAGEWTYLVSFRKGENIAISDDPNAGAPTDFDGQSGKITVIPAEPGTKGKLTRPEGNYLQFAGTGEYFLKGGADSPENFLAYEDFDGTYKGELPKERSGEATAKQTLHTYAPHSGDWKAGDPTWQGGKGKNMIGALNYLASKGMNSVYFLTMNIGGDGKDVWPYTGYEERERFDCSKLDQWEIVFDHMDDLGLMLHVVTQETENEKLLDDGNTEFHRKLYYRELIARFAHHLAVTWNLGEENGPANFSPNGQTLEQQKAMLKYIKTHDPYKNYLVIHTHSHDSLRHAQFDRLLGDEYLDGISIQIGKPYHSHSDSKRWYERSRAAGKQWVVTIDEIGPAYKGVDPDDREDNNQDTVRKEVLWGNLMAGGAGAEWYFGYKNHDNDLNCEDWRSRDQVWEETRYALDFFHDHLPFWEMAPADELISGDENYCFAKPGQVYAVYLPYHGTTTLNLEGVTGDFSVFWYNPRTGGELQKGSLEAVSGGSVADLGNPPADDGEDWAILVRRD